MSGNQPSYGANLLRQFGQGLTFGTSDELEAAFRAGILGQGDYAKLKANLENQRQRWADQNQPAATIAELGGAIIPGVAGAFVPGGQAATASTGLRVARAARALDAPLEAALHRFAPRALGALQGSKLGALATSLGDEMINGAMYSVGQAPTMSDAPKQVVDDALNNLIVSLGIRTATGGGGLAVRKLRGR
jgi:hypothetical protein